MVCFVKISVAMAVYNGEKYLKEQMDSILPQLEEDDELVISDDGSTDSTLLILEDYTNYDQRIVLLQGPHKGYPHNFQNAIIHCTGDIIFLCDQDDVWFSNKVKVVKERFCSNERIELVCHDAVIINDSHHIIVDSLFSSRGIKHGLLSNLIKSSYYGCCMAFKKELSTYIIPFPQNIPMHDQWISLIAEKRKTASFLQKPLIYYRRHGSNVSNKVNLAKRIYLRWILMVGLLRFNRSQAN